MLRRWLSGVLLVSLVLAVTPAEASRLCGGTTSDFLQATSVAVTTPWTLTAWIQSPADSVQRVILSNQTAGGSVYVRDTNKVQAYSAGFSNFANSTGTITGTGWHFVAVVIGASAVIFIDDTTTPDATVAVALGNLATGNNFLVCLDVPNSFAGAMRIALLTVFDADETANLAAIKASATPDTVDSANAVGAWYMCGVAGSLTDHSASAHDLVVNGTVNGDASDPPSCPAVGGAVKHRVIQ